MTTTSAGEAPAPDAPALAAWAPGEREHFLDAIARHRRAAWRVTAVCALASMTLAIVASLLLAPLLYCVIGLLLDVVNLFVRTPDLLGYAGRAIEPLMEDGKPAVVSLPWLVFLAMLPGLAVIGLALRALARAFRHSPLFDHDAPIGREPDARVLAEQRFRNTVEEMAVAAGIPAPVVRIAEGGANAAAFGPDDARSTVLVGNILLESLTREEMQGVAGHLVASIADGDVRIGMRTALTLGLFALYARMGSGFGDPQALRATRKLLRALIWPSAANTQYIMRQLADPFSEVNDGEQPAPPPSSAGTSNKLTWQQWAMMPLAGPVIFAGFMCGLVSTMMLTPLIALAWRQRKYMADAAAVRLTRQPDAIAGALVAIASRGATQMPPWAGHLCVVNPGGRGEAGLLGRWGGTIAFPPLDKRHRALVRLGAHPLPATEQRRTGLRALSLPLRLLVGFLFTLAGALMCVAVVLLVWVSVALTGLFTLMPAALLHAILR